MKRILVILVAVAVLAGGGFAAWKYLQDGGLGGEPAASEEEGGPRYVDMAPFIIQVIREGTVVRSVSVSIQLEVAGPAAEQTVQESMVYLRDAFWTRLHATLSRGSVGENYDAAKLKQLLRAQADQILGPGIVTEVLIGNTLEQSTGP